MELIARQNEITRAQDELEDYITFMERDFEQKAVKVATPDLASSLF